MIAVGSLLAEGAVSGRDAAVQAVMPGSTAAHNDSDSTQSPQGTRPDGLYRAVPVRAVYVRPGTSLIKVCC